MSARVPGGRGRPGTSCRVPAPAPVRTPRRGPRRAALSDTARPAARKGHVAPQNSLRRPGDATRSCCSGLPLPGCFRSSPRVPRALRAHLCFWSAAFPRVCHSSETATFVTQTFKYAKTQKRETVQVAFKKIYFLPSLYLTNVENYCLLDLARETTVDGMNWTRPLPSWSVCLGLSSKAARILGSARSSPQE